jgi:ABC-2 type transport system ATP-binding protein
MSAAEGATLSFESVSKWYGDTVAVADVSFALHPGVTGLLGHNGAGKSTALKLCAGLATPNLGAVRLLGVDPKRDPSVFGRVGIVPDSDGLWPWLTAQELVTACARMRNVPDPAAAAERALETVALTDVSGRKVGGYSKGMVQRVKLAQALVHDPDVLLLDEPLNGTDPAQRRHVIDLVRELGDTGKTVLVSSHVLHEVERMAPRVVVLVNGKLVAEGETAGIRELIQDRPRTIRIAAGERTVAIAQGLIGEGLVESVRLEDGTLVADTGDVDRFSRRLPALAQDAGATLQRVEPLGDDLESVYAYLTQRARGRA